jgi:hypothetical protein
MKHSSSLTVIAVLFGLLVFGSAACSAKSTQDAAPPPSTTPAAVAPSPAAPAPLEGEDFASDVRLLYRVVACSGDEPLPEGMDAAVVKAHCDWLLPKMESYRKLYVGVAQPYLAKLRPEGLPTSVVYPFGGGDLISALTSYPDAKEITTISLEHGGDPRRLRTLTSEQLAKSLDLFRKTIRQLLTLDDSASEDLMKVQRGGIPGQLSFFLVGLAVHGQEPVSLRYFRLTPEGEIHYLTAEEIAASEAKRAQKLNSVWNAPDFSEAFSNLEIAFRPVGSKEAPTQIHRHIAANLADGPLGKDPSLLRHLEAKGHVSAMIKAASYLIWFGDFSKIRNYLLANADFIFSDTTGIPPRYAAKAGFVQETYGSFDGTFIPAFQGPAYQKETAAFKELWASQPHREITFRYGYPDVNHRGHLMVTRRAPTTSAPAKP